MKEIRPDNLQSLPFREKMELIGYLSAYVTPHKLARFDEVIRYRTRHLTVALEDIYQPHNASAVLRTCDCFGIQDVHIIENKNRYEVNPDVALGSSKWLTLIPYNRSETNTVPCLESLKERGYRIVATTPHKNDFTPENLPLEQKTALVFGNELLGLSEEALSLADEFVKIPMSGFTESLNISVSAAVLIHALTSRLHQSNIRWRLSDAEQADVRLGWIMNVVKHSDLLVTEYFRKKLG